MAAQVSLGTAVFAGACVGVFLLQSAFPLNIGSMAIGAFPIVFQGQWYRAITSAFLHGGLLHIGMNMMSLLAMGPSVESFLGTVSFVLFVIATILLEGVFYVLMSVLGWAITGDASWLHIYAVGFSGVLFALAVEEATLSPAPTRSVFGLFSVPTRLYPWVLLLLMQFVLPNISFFGHLSGLLVGVLHVGQGLRWLLPSNDTARKLSSLPSLRTLPLFVHAPTNDPIAVAAERAGASGSCLGTVSLAFAALWEGISPIIFWLWGGLRGVLVAIGLGPCLQRVEGVVTSLVRRRGAQRVEAAAAAQPNGVFGAEGEDLEEGGAAAGVAGPEARGQAAPHRGAGSGAGDVASDQATLLRSELRDWGSGRVGGGTSSPSSSSSASACMSGSVRPEGSNGQTGKASEFR